MKQIGGRHQGDRRESKGSLRVIANRTQIEFLLSKLLEINFKYDKDDFRIGGKVTKKSAGAILFLRKKLFIDRKWSVERKSKKKRTGISLDNIEDLFSRQSKPTENSGCIQELAAVVLAYHNEALPEKQYNDLISSKTAWTRFLADFDEELSKLENTFEYLFYFWDGTKVQFAVVHLLINLESKEWKEGRLFRYKWDSSEGIYSNNEYDTALEFSVSSKKFLGYNVVTITATDNDKFIVNLVTQTYQDAYQRDRVFCTYTINDLTSKPATGVGLIVRYPDATEAVRQVNNNGQIDSSIYNILYERRDELDSEELANGMQEALPNSQEMEKLANLAGIYQGFFLRNDKPEVLSDRGGVEKNLLFIHASGAVELVEAVDVGAAEIEQSLTGFISFPKSESKLLKCNFNKTQDRIYQLHMFLMLHTDKGEKKYLNGIFSGWTSFNEPFSTIICFEEIETFCGSTQEQINELKRFVLSQGTKAPKFIPKNSLQDFFEMEMPEDVLWHLANNDHKYLNEGVDCLPTQLREEGHDFDKRIAGRFAGKYYLLSYEHRQGQLIRAPLEIFSDGNFLIRYQNLQFSGSIRYLEFGSVGSNGYIEFTITRKYDDQRDLGLYVGGYLFFVKNILTQKENNVYSYIDLIPGISYRVNSDHAPQAKKEYLIPIADDEFLPEALKRNKFTYFDFDFLNGAKSIGATQEDSKAFLKVLARSLMGREGNIITAPTGSFNNLKTDLRDVDYGEVYFQSFLFEIVFSEERHYVQRAYNYLTQSLLHGIKSLVILEKLGSFMTLLDFPP